MALLIMPMRLEHLTNIAAAYLKTGIFLVEQHGDTFVHPMHLDDWGIYMIVPQFIKLFHLPIVQGISLFFFLFWAFVSIMPAIACTFIYQNYMQRAVAYGALALLAVRTYSWGDVYVASYGAPLVIVPLALYCAKRTRFDRTLCLWSLFVGFWSALMNTIRGFSGYGPLIFFFLFTCTFVRTTQQRLTLLLLLAASYGSCALYVHLHYQRSVEFIQNVNPSAPIASNAHPFWHNIFLGFGLLKYRNDTAVEYDDNCAAALISKKYNVTWFDNSAYEAAVKNELIDLIKNNIMLVIFTLFAKIGIMLFWFLLFGNIGLIAAFFVRKPWYIDALFAMLIGYYAVFPVATMPTNTEYCLGFIAVTVLYAIVSINYAVERFYPRKMAVKKQKSMA